jgi:hypothetical protein
MDETPIPKLIPTDIIKNPSVEIFSYGILSHKA